MNNVPNYYIVKIESGRYQIFHSGYMYTDYTGGSWIKSGTASQQFATLSEAKNYGKEHFKNFDADTVY